MAKLNFTKIDFFFFEIGWFFIRSLLKIFCFVILNVI